MRFAIRYDLRNPPEWRRPFEEHYAHFLDQVAWADEHGFETLTLSEHHFSEDGYIPSMFPVAAAVAARTKSIRIVLSLVLLPLKHPVQVAEDGALVDIISNGRLELMLGGGYVNGEFEGYGISIKSRGGRMEEGTEIIKRCWEEEEFSFQGKYWDLKSVRVMPKPVQKPRPPVLMGGSSPAAARRAARLADGFSPTSPRLMKQWREEMARLGKDPGPEPPLDPPRPPRSFLHASHDPDAAWKRIAPHAAWESNSYAAWVGTAGFGVYQQVADPDTLRSSGAYGVMTPTEIVNLGKQMEAADPGGAALVFHPMMGGMPLDLGQESLDLVVNEVMPQFK